MIAIRETAYKGTRILVGNEKRKIISKAADYLISKGFEEMSIPIIQMEETFKNKVGNENSKLMFNFTDRGNRNLCLAPEYTAVIQQLSKTVYKFTNDIKIFYVQECFRGEKPQSGRYRQFTQLGVEVINPKEDYLEKMISIASELIMFFGIDGFKINRNVVRGLDYYKDGRGFEISYDKLGSSKQICGGGEYDGGIGFALGVDRLLSVSSNE